MMPEDVLFLDETGLLFQINRMILHPLGLEIYGEKRAFERYKQLGFVIQENPEGVPVAEH